MMSSGLRNDFSNGRLLKLKDGGIDLNQVQFDDLTDQFGRLVEPSAALMGGHPRFPRSPHCPLRQSVSRSR